MNVNPYLQVIIVCLLGAISPGPSMILVLNNSIYKSRLDGILSSLGHGLGITIYAGAAVIGLSFIIKIKYLFLTLQILGIFFLLYLGLKSFNQNNEIELFKSNLNRNKISFLEGFSIAILNPKIFIWLLAFYSQFISIHNEIFFNIYLFVIAGFIDTVWYVTLTFLASSNFVINFFKTNSLILQKAIGFIYIMIGIALLFIIIL